MGKNTVKGATQVSGHSLKQHFCMFEIWQMKHNSLDYNIFLGIFFSLIIKFTCSKLNTNQKHFCMFKHYYKIRLSSL